MTGFRFCGPCRAWRRGWIPSLGALALIPGHGMILAALLPAAALAGTGVPVLKDVPLRASYRIQDAGQPRNLELAMDEVAVVEGGRRVVRAVARAADAKSQGLAAKALQSTSSGAVELVLYPAGGPRTDATRRYVTRQVLVRMKDGHDAAAVIRALGVKSVRTPAYAPGYAIVEVDGPGEALAAADAWTLLPEIDSAEPMLARHRAKKAVPNDPLFADQWHLQNTGQLGGARWIDANLVPAWDVHRGAGIVVGIVDDGVQYSHPDLTANYNTTLDYDFNENDADPSPSLLNVDTHGTQVAGVIGARGSNSVGVAGTAYQATLACLKVLGDAATDDQEAQAMAYNNNAIHVKNSSWGTPDDGQSLEGPGPLMQAALSNGVTSGRGGRGVVYVFSGGNGLDVADDSNRDGYANSVHVIAVGAIDDTGVQTYYSEPGANLTVSAPSGDGLVQARISTTDITGENGENMSSVADDYTDRNYTKHFSGTSASAPVVSGVAALMLGVNPNLGWRDVQEILIASARRNHAADADWATNSAGYRFNHKYGAGLVDAAAAVGLASIWTNLGPRVFVALQQTGLGLAIPDNSSSGVTRTFNFTTNNFRVERVAVTLNATHAYRGDLEIILTSPAGTVSRLMGQNFDGGTNYVDWTFTSVRHWGESASGNWTVRVADRMSGDLGTLNSVAVRLYGSVVPGARVASAGATLTAESLLPANAAVDPGETVTVNVGLKNIGNAPVTNLTATLLALGGVSSPTAAQNYGTLTAGATATRSFAFRASGACGAGVTALFALDDGTRSLGVASLPVALGRSATKSLNNTGGIAIPATIGDGTPSPSTIAVSGMTGRLQRILVQVSGVTHTWLDDISTALAGPGGMRILLQDVATATSVSGLNWVFDGDAAIYIPAPVSASGTFKPDNSGGFWPPSAPTGEVAYTLGEFLGRSPTNSWGLYVRDWGNGDGGSIGSWGLTLTTMDCADNFLLESSSVAIDETNAVLAIRVLRTAGRDGPATVNYTTANGSAAAGQDYATAAGSLTFATGETSKTVNVTLGNDNSWEGNETFAFRLTGASGYATLGSVTSAVVTMRDGDYDRDGMPDDWETANTLAWADPNDGTSDADGDRLPNVAEFVADCGPRNSASYLGLTGIRFTNGWARVEWVGGSLARQWLECRTNLTEVGDTWRPLFTNLPPTAITNAFLDKGATNGLPFYRVRVQRD